jgi:iron complex outermembrane receptor protein
MQLHHFAGASALALAAVLCAASAHAADGESDPAQVIVTGQRLSPPNLDQLPVTVESVTADQIQATVNATTVEDTLKYLPDVFIRQRHIGDTQDPITTRTSGVGSSARSLIYADGVLLSALIGNNNTNASPRWGMVSPEEISRIDVLYGPFAAAFPGNSIGEVVEITTRMPDHFEATAAAEGAWQDFSQYGTKNTFPTGRASATLGDRFGKFSFRLSVDHTDTESQPLLYVTGTTPATTSTSGTPVTGSYAGANRNGAAIQILGAGGLEHQTLDNAKLKLGYDITPTLSAAYTLGFFQNNDSAGIQTYLQSAGAPVYSGTVNIGGRAYSVAASAFSNDRYHLIEDHIMQSLSIGSHTDGLFDWSAIASLYDYAKDRQRTPSLALPAAEAGGAGTILSLNGTGWETLDLKGTWRPQGLEGMNIVTFGLHQDGFKLDNPKYNTPDWIDGPETTTAAFSGGKTETEAAWLQDQIAPTSQIKLTLGGRYEFWRAFDGVNYSLTPALNVHQPDLSASHFSPKAVLAYAPTAAWRFSASIGKAYRFPTVEELYQSATVAGVLQVPNPNLKPEDATSAELAAERLWTGGHVRLSLFGEEITNALISQSGVVLPSNPTGLASFTQNVGKVRNQGVELVADQHDVLIKGLELSGWITYVQSKILEDAGYAPTFVGDTVVGKQLPQLPRLRASAVATYKPSPPWAFTVAARYSDKSYGTIDNIDHYVDTFTGFGSFFVVDIHARYQVDRHWAADLGVDNLGDRTYFEYHPFPQRTLVAKLSYSF